MNDTFIDCCEKMIALLDRLLADGVISQEEYDQHAKMKLKLLEEICR